jgi:hypothetical protein
MIDLSQPARQSVPTGAVLVHQTFISSSDFPQVAEGRRGYAGSNNDLSVERDSVWKEQLLEPEVSLNSADVAKTGPISSPRRSGRGGGW